MTGKTATSTSSVQVPQEVLDRYTAANNQASAAASQPFQQYSTDPSAFVAPLSATQQAGIQNTNTAANQAQPYYGAATQFLNQGQTYGQTGYDWSNQDVNNAQANANPYTNAAGSLAWQGASAVNPQQIGADQINQFMNPYIGDVLTSTSALLNQNNQQAMAGQLGNAIQSGAFGGDRAGIAAANLNQQQNLANANIYSGILNQGFNTALGAAQQQQGVNLGAQQANRAAVQQGSTQLENIGNTLYNQGMGAAQQQAANAQGMYNMNANTANSLAGLGAGAQSAALQGATAQLSAGQQEQATNQAGLTALYNQFLQQQAYPFQTAQFLANVAEGTGSLSGSTTSTTQPTGLFGNLLSDRRAKEDIKEIGRAKNGLKIYTFKYKGDPEKVTHLGFMADEVEKKHPDAVGLAGGLKTVNYERAARADGGGLMFDPNAGEYGLGAASMPGHGTYVPAPQQSSARRIMFQSTPPSPRSIGLGAAADQYKQLKGLYNDGKSLYNDGKSIVSGLGSAAPDPTASGLYARGGLALKRDDGGSVDDPFQSDEDMLRRQRGLAASETMSENAPNSATATPVSGALTAQQDAPRYSLGAAPSPKGNNTSGGLGELASIAGLGKDVLPYLLALKQGGLVPREHHADGDSVGDDDATVSPYGDLKSAKDAFANPPIPPKRPAGLGVEPAEVEKLPDLKMPDEPMLWHGSDYGAQSYHYQPNGRLGSTVVADAPPPSQSGLGAAVANIPGAREASGLDPSAATSAFLISKESGGKWDAVNPASSAYGLGQFTKSTAQTVSARHPELPPLSDFYSSDPNVSVPAQKAYVDAHARDQASVLKANGLDPTPGNVHMNWFLGERGGPAFLKGMAENPNAPGYTLAQPDQVAANKTVFFNKDGTPKTAAQVYASLNGGAAASGGGLGAAAPVAAQSQTPGLVGSLQSFVGGHPDGQTSPNGGMGERALMAVLSGLGAIGSYRGQSGLGALLQGLGAGAHGWMESGKQQADIANQQAQTGLVGAQTGETAARTGEIGARTGTQNATTMQARQELIGKARWVDPYGQMWVHTADDRVMTQDQWDQAGRPALYGQGLGATAVPPPAPTPPAGAGGPSVKSPAPPVAPQPLAAPQATKPLVTPPSPTKLPPVPFGVNLGDKSVELANNDVKSMQGPNFDALKTKAAEYPTQVQHDMQVTQKSMPYTQELAKVLNKAYTDPNSAKPGAGFGTQAAIASVGNSIERMFGHKETFGDADTQEQIANKIDTLRSTMQAAGAGQRALGALDELKAATPNLTQNPKASSALIAQIWADEVKARDQANHAQAYGQLSHGSYFNAANAFTADNGPEKYNYERDQLQRLLLNEKPQVVENLLAGKYDTKKIREQLIKGGYPESLARYFSTGD